MGGGVWVIVQASSRALIVDMVPVEQQDRANAWASRMIGIFNVLGYMNGYLDFPKIAPVFGNTEFKALSLISSGVLVLCGTTYIAEIYAENYCLRHSKSLDKPIDSDKMYSLIEDVTRYGSFGFMLFSIVSLLGTLLFPVITSSEKKIMKRILGKKYFNIIDKCNISTLWTMSHLLFGLCMFLTIFGSSVPYAMTIIALCGLSWAVTLWAPFSLISIELSLRNELHRSGTILGLHNIFVSAPQVISIVIAGIIFKFKGYKEFEDVVTCKGKMDYSLVWVFQTSGIAALIAMYLSLKISSEYTFINNNESN
ncbi:hypothetical protein PORY_001692 [Pneumocystis oryctolagi]|uniref:Uncharacterized protein n=1 Tax=Pneumocystis oryctolagi TaxID=42067 RepID=A0ACB7CD68_9ASCO|nr:hypothetical protein PORY_001692 [Pneumocystis oryctolagi]